MTEVITTNNGVGIAALSSQYDFRKVSLTISGWVPVLPRTSFRLFTGGLRGSYPSQEAIFLSGSPKPIGVAYWFLDPDRKISTQENLHVADDANLRGYVGQHLRGRNALSVNSDYAVPKLSFLRAFVDVDSVWDSGSPKLRWNAGVGFDFELLRFHCPVFMSDPLRGEKKFVFRWLIHAGI